MLSFQAPKLQLGLCPGGAEPIWPLNEAGSIELHADPVTDQGMGVAGEGCQGPHTWVLAWAKFGFSVVVPKEIPCEHLFSICGFSHLKATSSPVQRAQRPAGLLENGRVCNMGCGLNLSTGVLVIMMKTPLRHSDPVQFENG